MIIAEDVEFEVWDAEFLDQVIQVEELAHSTASQNPNPNPDYPSFFFPPAPPQPPPLETPRPVSVSNHISFSYSPPRELSQRVTDLGSFSTRPSVSFSKCAPSSSSSSTLAPGFPSFDIEKEDEIDRLKRELGRLSKQLIVLEQECVELKKKGDKGEENLKIAFVKNDEIFAEDHLKSTKQRKLVNDGRDSGGKCDFTSNHDESQQLLQKMPSKEQTSACNDIGIQTDIAHDSVEVASNDHLLANHDLSKKLLDIWVSPNEKQFGQNLVSKLFTSCEADFLVLFGYMSMKLSSHENSSDKAWEFYMRSLHGSEAVEVSCLYSMLAKVSSGMAKMDALFAPLLDLCSLDNVVIAHKSLHVLHVLLKHLLSFERKSERRKNVMVERVYPQNNVGESLEGVKVPSSVRGDKTSHTGDTPIGIKSSDMEILCKSRQMINDTNFVAPIDWISIFESVRQIAMKHAKECVRFEAVSILNLILMRSNAHTEREKFGPTLLFECVLNLIEKEAGLQVQDLAIQLLFLILNCPKLLAEFCSGCKEEEAVITAENSLIHASSFHEYSKILQGLADCVSCSGNGIQELKLRRNSIHLLAFLASSGKAGFEILVRNTLARQSNFLMLILQVVVLTVDFEVGVGAEPPEITKERTLLVREALILLNRLVSYPSYSLTVLRLLTTSRDMASLTIDIANRLSWRDHRNGQLDSITSVQVRGSEITELALQFKKRVFAYLGDDAS